MLSFISNLYNSIKITITKNIWLFREWLSEVRFNRPVRILRVIRYKRQRRLKELKVKEVSHEGLYVGPVTWNIVFRPAVSLLAGLLISTLIWAVLEIVTQFGLLGTNPLSWWILLALSGALAYQFGDHERNKDGDIETEKVPGTKLGALVTFYGAPLPFGGLYRTSGDYTWTGKRLFFGRSKKVSDNGTDDEGFVKLGDVQIPIWNASDQKGKLQLSNIAKNRASVFGTLTLVIRHRNPRLWLDSDDPTLDIADRSRQAYREIVDMLVDTDVPSVHRFLGFLLRGQAIITTFIKEGVGDHKAGSMIRDRSGSAMFHIVKDDESKDDAIKTFISKLAENADPEMLKLIMEDKSADTPRYHIKTFKVSETIDAAIDAVGATLVRTTFGDIELSDPVKAAANQASAESDERIAQVASAKTNRIARQQLLPTEEELKNPGFELATVLAAAQDDKTDSIKVVMVPGGNKLASAMVAGANQIGGTKS